MSNQDNLSDIVPNPSYSNKSETERIISVFDSFSKDDEETKSLSAKDIENDNQPVLTMSSLGKLGRFGNQMFQYAFLRICADNNGARVECPPWIGQTLFGHKDRPISNRLPPAIERWDVDKNLFDIIPEFIPYIETLADAKSSRISSDILNYDLVNVDLWGFFQLHTRLLRPYKQYFCSLFQPVDDLKYPLEDGVNILRSKGKTIIGIHIRRGDFIKEPRAGFTLVIPSKWYCERLEEIWDKLEDPVLFLCSDDLDNILTDFDKFSPVTSRELNIKLPKNMKDLDIEFYIDFFILSNCDVVITSNSIFSFVACMLNQRAKMFIRPHWDFSSKFVVFDPWDSEPLLWLGGEQAKFFKSLTDILYTNYVTQGFWAMLKCLFIYLPTNRIKGWLVRAYLGYKIQSVVGVVKSLLYTLGWHSAWKIPGLYRNYK